MPKLPRRLLAAHGSNFCAMSKPQRGARQSPLSTTCNIDNRFRVIFDAVNDGIFI